MDYNSLEWNTDAARLAEERDAAEDRENSTPTEWPTLLATLTITRELLLALNDPEHNVTTDEIEYWADALAHYAGILTGWGETVSGTRTDTREREDVSRWPAPAPWRQRLDGWLNSWRRPRT